jgi:hypothetical protein
MSLPPPSKIQSAAWERSYLWRATRSNSYVFLLSGLLGIAVMLFVITDVIDVDTMPSAPLLIAAALVLAGLFATLVIVGLGDVFNTTRLRLADGRLQVQVGPLPWPSTLNLPAGEITALDVRELVQKKYQTYRLTVGMANGRQIMLLDQFKSRQVLEQAAAELRQALEL